MGEEQDANVIKAVTEYVYHRHSDLTLTSVIGFSKDELEIMQVNKNGYLVFTVEDVSISEKIVEDDNPIWYVSATLYFLTETEGETVEGSTDTYECYRCGNNWCIEWYSS